MSDSTREALAAKLRTFIDHYDAKPSLEYIRLTRDEASDIAEALSAPAPQAEPQDDAALLDTLTWVSCGLQHYLCHDANGRVLGNVQQNAIDPRWNVSRRDGGAWVGEYMTEDQAKAALVAAIRAARGAGGKT